MNKATLLFVLTLLIPSIVSAQDSANEEHQPVQLNTYPQPTGNRIVDGSGIFPDVEIQDVFLSGTPVWLTGYATERTLVWHVSLATGDLVRLEVDTTGQVLSNGLVPGCFAPLQPLAFAVTAGDETMLCGDDTGSRLTHPILLDDSLMLSIANGGAVTLLREDEVLDQLPLNAMLDARLVVNAEGQVAVYVDPTRRYAHGIMGDELEAAGLVIFTVTEDRLQVQSRIDLPDDDVFEGLFPIWADVDEDGEDDLIVTVSNRAIGAQLRVYQMDGTLLADGPAIGRGSRWRHQLAWGPFGPDGENELVDVLTPHIGGVVEFFAYQEESLQLVARETGYSSHVIASRNLDMAVAGDFNGDDQIEIVVPNQARNFLAGLQHDDDGVRIVWQLPLDGQIATNLSALMLPDGRLTLAVGTADGRLRLWWHE